MNETILYVVGGLAIAGVAFFLFKNMKKGIKKTTDLHEERKKNDS
jgi:hypothetical protein